MPRYWLSGEEKKLLWKLRKEVRPDSGDYWRHLIPRTEKELSLMMDMIPDNAVEKAKSNEAFSWRETQSRILPDGTKEIRTVLFQANLASSVFYFVPLQPFSIHPMPDGISANPYETREWIPELFDVANKTWRNASRWECDHWEDLVNCSSCNHPTIPQFACNVCGKNLVPPLAEIQRRILYLICVLPDTPDFATTEEVISEEIEPQEETETSELEDIIEEKVKEEQPEREEEDEEAKDNSND